MAPLLTHGHADCCWWVHLASFAATFQLDTAVHSPHTHTHTHDCTLKTTTLEENRTTTSQTDRLFTTSAGIHRTAFILTANTLRKTMLRYDFFFSIYVFPKERRQMGQITWSSMRMIWKPGTSATQGEWKPPVIRPGYYPRHCTLMKTYQLTIDFQIQYSAPLPGCDRNLLPVQYWSPSPQPAPSVTNVGRLATRNQCQQPVMLPLDAQM